MELRAGMLMEHRTFRWRIVKRLGSGPFSDVFEVQDTATAQNFAMKIEKVEKCLRPVLKLDALVLSQLTQQSNTTGFPRLVAAGRCADFKYIVMQLLGPDLRSLHRAMAGRKFTIGTALRVACDTLDRIQTLHSMGWLCRDVKANNYVIGCGADVRTIYMLDFGFARRFLDNRGYLLPPRAAAALLGTIHYAPLASHFNQEQCRRDDLESWFYMVVEITTGGLPWMFLEPISCNKIIAEWKRFVRNSGRDDFLSGVPEEFDQLLDYIDSLSFTEGPNYELVKAKIASAMDRLKVDRSAPLDWQANNGYLIEKSRFVGPAGESHLASAKLRMGLFEQGEIVRQAMTHAPNILANIENANGATSCS